MDLRIRVVEAYDRGEGTLAEIAERFCVVKATVCNWLKLRSTSGGVAPRPHAGGTMATLSGDALVKVCALVTAKNDVTVEELRAQLAATHGITTSRAAIWRALRKAGITRKKSPLGRRT